MKKSMTFLPTGTGTGLGFADIVTPLAHVNAENPTRVDVFDEIFIVFLILGTLVGVVVISYMLYNARKYRDTGSADADDDFEAPQLGELPRGNEAGGKKLFLSFAISAIIVVSLIVWTYGMLLYVEERPDQQVEDNFRVEVEGYQFGWQFTYPNGHVNQQGELRVPLGQMVTLEVTSRDVFHSFGAPELHVKADAMPGQEIETWFQPEQTGEYQVVCYELCGAAHSQMTGTIIVMENDEFNEWYANTEGENDTDAENGTEGENDTHRLTPIQ